MLWLCAAGTRLACGNPVDLHYVQVAAGTQNSGRRVNNFWKRNATMAWTTPTLVEICIGLEINGYLPAEI